MPGDYLVRFLNSKPIKDANRKFAGHCLGLAEKTPDIPLRKSGGERWFDLLL
jgi:hypothetical protein